MSFQLTCVFGTRLNSNCPQPERRSCSAPHSMAFCFLILSRAALWTFRKSKISPTRKTSVASTHMCVWPFQLQGDDEGSELQLQQLTWATVWLRECIIEGELCMKKTSRRLYPGTAARRFSSKVTHDQLETPATCSPWVVSAVWSSATTQKQQLLAAGRTLGE